MSTRKLVFSDGSSNKFWNIELNDDSHTVNFGRVGTGGQTKTKQFADAAAAKKSFDKLVNEKLSKGYVDASGGSGSKKKAMNQSSRATTAKKAVKTAAKKATAKTTKKTAKKTAKKAAKKTAAKGATQKATTTKASKASPETSTTSDSADSCHLVFEDAKSSKFWSIDLHGSSHTVRYGRQGTDGQSKTKDFDSDQAARKSFEKLVAEKRKKGYVDGAAAGSAPRSTPATSATKPAAADAVEPAEPRPEVVLEVTAEIGLTENDWAMASFRPRTKHQPQPPREFDLDACTAMIANMNREEYGWQLPFEKLALPLDLSPEEAHFWLVASTQTFHRLGSKAEVKKFANQIAQSTKFDGKITLAEVDQRINKGARIISELVMLPLANLFSPEECLQIVLGGVGGKKRESSEVTVTLAQGFRKYVLRRATDKALAAMRKSVAKTLDPTAQPPNDYHCYPTEHYFAAVLGMHKEVYRIVSSWEDDHYKSSGEDSLDHYQYPQYILFGLENGDLVDAEWRRIGLGLRNAEQAKGLLACTELKSLDLLVSAICRIGNREECTEMMSVLALVRAPEAAEPILECRLNSKASAVARDWMDQYVGNCVAGLVETAGQRGKLGDAAIDYLRGVKRNGHEQLIRQHVDQAGKDSAGAARIQKEVLDHVERTYTPFDEKTTPAWLKKALAATEISKPAKLPAWATAPELPPIGVGERRLSDEQVTRLLQVLATTPVTEKHPLTVAIREHADTASCDEFAWHLFQTWLEDGANSKLKWAMSSIGHLGGDRCVLQLTPLVRAWPGESQHPRAVLGLECLRAIGSDLALMQLSGIAQKLKFKGLKAKAAGFVEEIASEKGMTRDELEDRVIPDCGLDERGRREFSFGNRSFAFVLGGDLKPMVRDEKGKVRPNPPKPGVNDDKEVAEASLAEWKLIKKQIKDVAVLQSGRLEQAMVTQRRWSVENFESLLVNHPLMTHLTQKVIWGAFNKAGKRILLFRVSEERDYADVDDQEVSLDKAVSVGVVHPLDLSEKERSAWGEVFSDYELVSPFTQLGREVHSLEEGEDRAKELKRFHGIQLYAPTMVFTLEKLGWTRGEAMDAGCFDEHSKQFPAADVTAVIRYDGTVGMGYIDPDELLKTESVHFCRGMRGPSGYGWGSEKMLKLGDVSPIVISEVIADLNVLKSKAK